MKYCRPSLLSLQKMSKNFFFFFYFYFLLLFFFFPSHLWLGCLSAVNITRLPGFHGELPFHLETGYVSVDDESRAELFYYFVESERKPEEDPLILWLTGGPGCSGFAGLALHMGPLNFKTDNFDGSTPTLVTNPYAWTKIASMIFLDWPVGTGFSYSTSDKDYITEDIQTKRNIYKFLRKWLLDHPNFVSNPFYMGGESYGGKMATLLSHEIVQGNEQGQNPLINIKGYIVGNAVTGEKTDKNSQVEHAYGLGVISEELYKLIQTNCEGEDYLKPQGAVCKTHLQVFEEFLSEINVFGILEPLCSDEPQKEMLGLHRSLEENSADFLNQPSPDINCITPDLLANYWANSELARNVLQVEEGTVGRWHRCNFNIAIYNYTRSIPSSVPYHKNLTTRGYRALVYSGDHDLQIPFVGTLEWIKSLGFAVVDPWRSWHAGGQVAGYTISLANNLTFATVKGGNHLAPVQRPMQTFVMFERYVTMNEKSGAELFYYLVESERNPSEDPLLLWLLGGPGCSAINGMTLDMGPLRFKLDDFDGQLPNLYANPFAWTKISNMIFVDWPIGTGFSYSKTAQDYTTEDVNGTEFIYEFLRKWLLDHPSFLSNPFYMGGDSYGGKIAVLVAHKIVEGNEGGQEPLINFKGYLVGNAATGEKVDTSSQVPHAYGLGIISTELYQLIMANCAGEDFKQPHNELCANHLDTFNGFLSEINSYSILDPDCSDEPPSTNEMPAAIRSLKENPEEFLTLPSSSVPDISCITGDLLANYWGNHHLVKEALHVKEGTIKRFHRCDFNVNSYHYTRSIPSSVPYHFNLITRGFRALVYSGDHDLRIPFLGTLEWIKSLNFSVLEPWRSWHAGGQVAGYTILFSNNLTFATVKGGSHVAPGKMPLECFVMFESWISHKGL